MELTMTIDPEFNELNRNFMAKQRKPYSAAFALEAVAKEIVSAAALYQQKPQYHDALAAALETLVGRLNQDLALFLRHRAEEAADAPQK